MYEFIHPFRSCFFVADVLPHRCPPALTSSCRRQLPISALGTCNSSCLSGFSILGACWTRMMHNPQPMADGRYWINGTASAAPSGMILRRVLHDFIKGLQGLLPTCWCLELAHCLMLYHFFPFPDLLPSLSSLSHCAPWDQLPNNLPALKSLSSFGLLVEVPKLDILALIIFVT